MEPKEKLVLNELQKGLPLVSRPFKATAETLGLTEHEVLKIYKDVEAKGLIRRFGGIVNISEMGIASTLVGLKVHPGHVETVASMINQYEGVTHNYERDDQFNLWFTLMAPNQARLDEQIEDIRAWDEVQSLINLPSRQKFKTKVILKL